MENGMDIVDGSLHLESKREEGEVQGERVLGSDGLKDIEGEDVFEEAVDAQEHFHEQETKLNPEEATGGGNGNLEPVDVSASELINETPVGGQEVEKFEEALSTPLEASRHEERTSRAIFDQKMDMVGVSIDGIDIEETDFKGTENGAVSDESKGIIGSRLLESKESGVKEELGNIGIGGSIASGGKEGMEDNQLLEREENGSNEGLRDCGSQESGGKEGMELEREESGSKEGLRNLGSEESSDKEGLRGDPVVGSVESGKEEGSSNGMEAGGEESGHKEVAEFSAIGDMKSVKDGVEKITVCGLAVEKPEDLEQINHDELLKKQSTANRGNGYIESYVDMVSDKMMKMDTVAEELKENELDTERQVENTKEELTNGGASDVKLQDEKVVELHDNLGHMEVDPQNENIKDFEDERKAIDIRHLDVSGEELRNRSSCGDAIGSEKLEGAGAGAGANPEPPGKKCGLENASLETCTSLEEKTVVSDGGSTPSAEYGIDKTLNLQPGNPNPKEADGKVSEIQYQDENVNGDQGNVSVTQEPRKVQEENLKDELSSQMTREEVIQPRVDLVASSGKSASSDPTPARPAGLGRAAPLLEPAPRVVQQPRVNGTLSQMQSQQVEDSTVGDADEYDETREKLQMIRVKFLRLAHRLGQTPHNTVVAQVLYRLGLAEQLRGGNGGRVGAFSFDRASAMAEQLESTGQDPLDFSCTIMVLGKTGVGKSATINSIFDEVKFSTDAFQMGTKTVQDVVGTVQGIKVRVIDTPGLLPSWSDQRQNEKILHSVRRFIKKTAPDIVLYLDRLDMQSRDFGDMPLLRTITDIFGPSIWFNAIVVLTHAASAPPEGPNGTTSSYDMFVTQRSTVVQQAIRQAAGDMRLMNPVSLVENHSACRTNRAGQRVLPNGQVWKPHLLLLSFASKILAEANTLLKLQDNPPGRPFAARTRAPPLPFLLSSLLQSRPQLKLPEEQFDDEDSPDDDLGESSDSEDEIEFDELPPFKHLTKAQVEKLSKAQRKAYFDELEYREKLFMKKQLKEERKRRKMMKKMAAAAKDLPSDYSENVEEENGGAASIPVPMPDLALPASFDSDNPTHRYRYLDSSNQWLVRPVLETHGWDHDVGYEGINVERLFVVKDRIPLSFSGQVTKDKKEANLQMEVSSSIKHGEGKGTSLSFDIQTVGKEMAYTFRSETKFSNFRRNKAAAGFSVSLLGDALSAGVKVEDKLIANKRFKLVVTGGAMSGRGDVAYGGSLEAQLRDKDYPLGRSLSTLSLSVMDWHGDLAIGCNVQSQIPVGRSANLIARVNLNNRGAGQVSVRFNSSEQLQIALIGLMPLIRKLVGISQQLPFGQ